MNGDDYVPGGITRDEACEMVRELESAGVDILNVSTAVYVTPHLLISPLPLGPGVHLHLSAGIKRVVNIPVIGVGRSTSPDFTEQALRDENADLIALGRALLADPEWPNTSV